MIGTIITEMTKGNFSFLILVVGILQLVLMCMNYRLTLSIKKDEEDIKDGLD